MRIPISDGPSPIRGQRLSPRRLVWVWRFHDDINDLPVVALAIPSDPVIYFVPVAEPFRSRQHWFGASNLEDTEIVGLVLVRKGIKRG